MKCGEIHMPPYVPLFRRWKYPHIGRKANSQVEAMNSLTPHEFVPRILPLKERPDPGADGDEQKNLIPEPGRGRTNCTI